MNTSTVWLNIFLLSLKIILNNQLLTISTATTKSAYISIFFCFMKLKALQITRQIPISPNTCHFSTPSHCCGQNQFLPLAIQWENLPWTSANAPSLGLIWQGQTENISPHLLKARHGSNPALSSCQRPEVGSQLSHKDREIDQLEIHPSELGS